MKALKKSLAQQEAASRRDEGERCESRSSAAAEQARLTVHAQAANESVGAARPAVKAHVCLKEQSAPSTQTGGSRCATCL